ncbi:putative ATP-dependent dethiobiotin synthetase [Rosellinia necatrix]|uniref:Putative ATP-dependent dethiobiotin synthetase n=1 Tax=Rosellinia necatrix TaxID=77044 RepID=A0A1S7UKU8_ROSNE|nr:putative ATP-dependent dethiobiotin synthetase [Rosellinia necatrix]
MQGLLTLATTTLAAALFSATGASAQCAREALVAATEKLLAAQTAGQPEVLLGGLAGGAAAGYLEQFRAADARRGILATPLRLDFNRSLHDAAQCATYTEMVAARSAHPYVIGTQMRFTPGGEGDEGDGITLANISSLVTDQGDWLFNATGTLYWAARESWAVIPEDQRDSRETIKAAADAYADIFNDKSVKVPWGSPCARLEGGAYTGNGSPSDRCDVGIPNGVALKNRRYVIDETIGAVDVFIDFATVPDSHEFRIEKGKIRFVHTITVMGG